MIAILAAVAFVQQPQSVLGADRVLDRLSQVSAKAAPATPIEKVKAKLAQFEAHSDGMPPALAARDWLKLLDEWEKAKESPNDGWDGPANAIPAPASWPLIRQSLAKRTPGPGTTAFSLYFDRLMGRTAQLMADLEKHRAKPMPGVPEGFDFQNEQLDKVELSLGLATRNAGVVSRELARGSSGQFATSFFFFDGVPDLVGLFGKDAAGPILSKLLWTAGGPIDSFNGSETRALARSITLADFAHIKRPQWNLADGPADESFVLKLIALNHGKVPTREDRAEKAEAIYAAYLLRSGDTAKAASYLSGNPVSFGYAGIDPAPLLPQIEKVLDQNPSIDLWREYVDAAMRRGQAAEALARIDRVLTVGKPSDTVRGTILTQKAVLLEAQGKAGPAAQVLAEALNVAGESYERDRVWQSLGALAEATRDPKLVQLALDSFKPSEHGSLTAEDPATLLLDTGRLAEAEKFVLSRATAASSTMKSWEAALMLFEIYYRANRPQDIVTVLDGLQDWPRSDLFDLVDLRLNAGYREDLQGRPLGYYAAWAFAKIGRKDLAIRSLHDLLRCDDRSDDAFRLLNQTEGQSGLAFYDGLISLDRFAARPVAWKADLLRRLGRLADAEALARHAIAIDPTDGDAPAGHRLVSFWILADTLEAEGKTDEAKVYRQVVQAVRLGEQGDMDRDAGLLPQAMEAYRQAEALAAKAYCIHARMGITLMSEGKPDEASKEFEKAYELMPGSMGELSSMCFACSGMFQGAKQEQLAIEVLEGLAKAAPQKAQVRYLLGQVYQEAGQLSKAAAAYEEAVRLDPDYLDAYQSLAEIAKHGSLSPDQAAIVALAMVRLEPTRLYQAGDALTYVGDLSTVWRVLDKARKALPPLPRGPLYPLHGRKPTRMDGRFVEDARPIGDDLAKGPSAAVGSLEMLRELLNLRLGEF